MRLLQTRLQVEAAILLELSGVLCAKICPLMLTLYYHRELQGGLIKLGCHFQIWMVQKAVIQDGIQDGDLLFKIIMINPDTVIVHYACAQQVCNCGPCSSH